MRQIARILPALSGLLLTLACLASSPAESATQPDPNNTLAAACEGHDGWADPAPATRIFANTWYVGTCGITALLVTGEDGHVLIDSGVEEAAPLVLANIRALGFNPTDVHWILSSHEHNDHIGAHAALQQATGAKVAALAAAVEVMESGKASPDDPQAGTLDDFPAVHVDRVLADGDVVSLGTLAFTVHATPAHTAGSASWTWQSCDENLRGIFDWCFTMAYADSATAISARNYRFSDHPDRIAAVRQGLSKMAALPCDILITPHPGASDPFDRLSDQGAALIDSTACTRYAQAALGRFEKRLAQENAPAPKEAH